MKYTLIRADLEKKLWETESSGTAATAEYTVERRGLQIDVRRGGERWSFSMSAVQADGSYLVATPFGSMKLALVRGEISDAGGAGKGRLRILKSSMPGKVVKILCKLGENVEKDQPLLIIEAMKMENEIRSPVAGVVTELGVEPGRKVETGELLAKIEAAEG